MSRFEFAPFVRHLKRAFGGVTAPRYEAETARRQLPALLRSRLGGEQLLEEIAALEGSV